MPDSSFADQMMGMMGAGGGPGPGGPPGVGPGGPGGPPGAGPAPGGPPGGGGPPQDPMQQIQAALTLLTIAMSQIGLTETAQKAVQLVAKSVEKLTKSTPQGRQGAVMQGAVPPSGPPGVGPMPGANVV